MNARVTNDDERYDLWLTTAAYRSAVRREKKETERNIKAGVRISERVAPSLAPAAVGAASRVRAAGRAAGAGVSRALATRVAVGAGTAATVGIGTAAAAAIVVGAASYFATRWVIAKYGQLTNPDDRAFAAAAAYREARRDAEKKLGRPLSVDENARMGAEFKAKLKTIGWGG